MQALVRLGWPAAAPHTRRSLLLSGMQTCPQHWQPPQQPGEA